MKNARDYLEEALTVMGDMSDAKKAERLKVSRQSVSAYRKGERTMDDFVCILVARELGIDPLEVIAAANMERERTQERRDFWQDFRSKIGITGLAGLIVLGTMMPQPAQANASLKTHAENCTLCKVSDTCNNAAAAPCKNDQTLRMARKFN